MRTWKDVQAHPSVEDAYQDSDGYWLHLKQEYFCEGMGCRTVHEYTVRDLIDMMTTVVKL
jgi:hypothetical protein